LQRKPLAEVHYLEQVIADSAAGLAVSKMPFDVDLLPQLERPVDVFG